MDVCVGVCLCVCFASRVSESEARGLESRLSVVLCVGGLGVFVGSRV